MESPIVDVEDFIRKKELKKNEFPKSWTHFDDDIIDGRPVNTSIRKAIADDFIISKMKESEQQYTSYLGLDIWVGTWNVNGKKIDENITPWLCAGGANHTDMFIVGLEEMVDLTATTVVSEAQSQRRSQIWIDQILTTLHQNYHQAEDTYYCVSSKILVGIFLCVFARVSLKPTIHNIMTSSVATGLLGMMGNKGGVGIRMDINNSSIAFICCHFAAHREKVAERNADYRRILNEMKFTPNTSTSIHTDSYSILNHDMVFWLGDLNYRIVSDVPNNVIFEYAKKNYTVLLKKDQLIVSQKAGFVFKDFFEPEIHFPPTYKFIRQTSMYDERMEKKIRAPSWCDRVLYYIRERDPEKPCCIKVSEYDSVPSLVSSDHKPVYLRAVLLIKKYNEEIMMQRKQEALDLLAWGDTPMKPLVQVSDMEVVYDELHYKKHIHRSIHITNKGPSNAYFHFLPRDLKNTIALPLFTLSEYFGVILANQTKEIDIDAYIGYDSLSLIEGKSSIEDMIAVRIDNCGDFYFHLTAPIVGTSFGKSLNELVHMKQPATENEKIDLSVEPLRIVPYELWSMIDVLSQEGLLVPNLWKEQSTEEELSQVRELIDQRKDLHSIDPHCIANTMTEWIRSFKIPVFPKEVMKGLAITTDLNCQIIDMFLAMIPRENRNVFIYVMKFLQELLKHSQWNQLDAEFLTMVFSQAFIGEDIKDEEDEDRQQIVAQNVIVNMIRFLLTPVQDQSNAEEVNEGESDSE